MSVKFDKIYIANIHSTYDLYVSNHIVCKKEEMNKDLYNELKGYKAGELISFSGFLTKYNYKSGEINYSIKINSINKKYRNTNYLKNIIEFNSYLKEDYYITDNIIYENDINNLCNSFISKSQATHLFIGTPNTFVTNLGFNLIYCNDVEKILFINSPFILKVATINKVKLFVFGAISYLSSNDNLQSFFIFNLMLNSVYLYYAKNKLSERDIKYITMNLMENKDIDKNNYCKLLQNNLQRIVNNNKLVDEKIIEELYIKIVKFIHHYYYYLQ